MTPRNDALSIKKQNVAGSVIAGRDFTVAQAEELHAEAGRLGINVRTLVLELFPDPNAPIPAGPLLNHDHQGDIG